MLNIVYIDIYIKFNVNVTFVSRAIYCHISCSRHVMRFTEKIIIETCKTYLISSMFKNYLQRDLKIFTTNYTYNYLFYFKVNQ